MLSDEEKRMIYEGEKAEQKDEIKAKNDLKKMGYYVIIIIILLSVLLVLSVGFHIVFYNYQKKISPLQSPLPAISSYTSTAPNIYIPKALDSGYKLKLLEWHWIIEGGYAIVEGEVQNISSESLVNVNAVVAFYDSKEKLITSAENIIAYSPILAGQISLFRVKTIYNPDMVNANIDFKLLNGESIPTKYVLQIDGT